MAAKPLFIADLSTLKAALRLEGAVNADAVIAEAVGQVRVEFYGQLGSDRITTILGYVDEENPTTPEGLMRLRAKNTEVSWVRLMLWRTMPVLFQDGTAIAQQAWNQEAFTRSAPSVKAETEIARLQGEVNDNLVLLREGDIGSSVQMHAHVIGTERIESPQLPVRLGNRFPRRFE